MAWNKTLKALATISACLALLATIACDEAEPACAEIDITTLDADTVVLAVTEGGGFFEYMGDMFFAAHHGNYAAYVFGDGRFMTMQQDWGDSTYTRTWRRGLLSGDDFQDMLDLAACLDDDDGGDYTTCLLLDGPSQGAAVNLPNASFTATAQSAFNCHLDEDAVPPPQALADVAGKLIGLLDAEATEFVPDRIVLGGHMADNGYYDLCATSEVIDWTFTGVNFSDFTDETAAVLIESPLAGQIRDFIEAHPADTDSSFLHACVNVDGTTWLMYCDNAPDEEESLPF